MSFLGVNKESLEGITRILDQVPDKRHLLPTNVWHLRLGHSNWAPRKTTFVEDMRLLFVRSGEGRYWIDGEEFPIRRNTIIFLNTGTTFQHSINEEAPPHIVACSLGLRENTTQKVLPSPAPTFHVAYNTGNAGAIEPYFLMLADAHQRRTDRCQHDLQKGCLHCILGRIRTELTGLLQANDPRIEKGRQMLADNPVAQICWEELAKSVGMSRDYFCRCFSRELGISPKSYHLRIRMEYAQFLLESSNTTVHEVARSLGYADAFIFSRQFKRSRGATPSAVRKGRR